MTATVEEPAAAQVREGGEQPSSRARRRETLIALGFIAPALVLLGALVVYPMIYTLIRSFYNASGDEFIGWDNYVTMFTSDTTFTSGRPSRHRPRFTAATYAIHAGSSGALLRRLKTPFGSLRSRSVPSQ